MAGSRQDTDGAGRADVEELSMLTLARIALALYERVLDLRRRVVALESLLVRKRSRRQAARKPKRGKR